MAPCHLDGVTNLYYRTDIIADRSTTGSGYSVLILSIYSLLPDLLNKTLQKGKFVFVFVCISVNGLLNDYLMLFMFCFRLFLVNELNLGEFLLFYPI